MAGAWLDAAIKAAIAAVHQAGLIPGLCAFPTRAVFSLTMSHHDGEPSLMIGFFLDYKSVDSRCDAGTALAALSETIDDFKPLIVLGPGCSTVAEPLQRMSNVLKLPVISPSALAPFIVEQWELLHAHSDLFF